MHCAPAEVDIKLVGGIQAQSRGIMEGKME